MNDGAWINAAGSSYLIRSHPKTLEFSLPEEVKEGICFVAVRIAYLPSERPRRGAVVGFSRHPLALSGWGGAGQGEIGLEFGAGS